MGDGEEVAIFGEYWPFAGIFLRGGGGGHFQTDYFAGQNSRYSFWVLKESGLEPSVELIVIFIYF